MVSTYAVLAAMAISGSGGSSHAGETVLLDFQAPWCGPCREMEPVVDALIRKGYPVRRVNVDQEPELTRKHRVGPIPCFVMLVDGQEVARAVGADTSHAELERMCLAASNRAGRNRKSRAPVTLASAHEGPLGARMSPAVATSANAAISPELSRAWDDERLLYASVRIRVEDADGHSSGSGTIIDTRQGWALILTCGHIFRDSKGKGHIDVDLFGPQGATRVSGSLISYDSEYRDIGLVSIRPSMPVAAARVAPTAYRVTKGDRVASVGCNNGERPTVQHSHVASLNKFEGAPNIQVAGQPVEGRSGGGLFSKEGYVIGVCNAADPSDHEGLYAALDSIRGELDRARLSFAYQSPSVAPPSRAPMVAVAPPAMAKQAPPSLLGPRDMTAAELGVAAESAGAMPSPETLETLTTEERATLVEILRRMKNGAEVLCVVRPRHDPQAQSEIIVLDRASPAFLRQLAAGSLPLRDSELIPTSRRREPPVYRSPLPEQPSESFSKAPMRR